MRCIGPFLRPYYSAFSVCLAFFKAVGYTEESHANVIKKVGLCMGHGYYPATVAFHADGGKARSHFHVLSDSLPWSLYWDSDPATTDAHIRGFLNGTRDRDIRRWLLSLNKKTKQGKPKKNFSVAEYESASNKVGPTSLMSLLYRKRIKANYQDIDTFLHPDLDAPAVFGALAQCVWCLNFVHEAFISAAIGSSAYKVFLGALPAHTRFRVEERATAIDGF